jgi:hypothetical protein
MLQEETWEYRVVDEMVVCSSFQTELLLDTFLISKLHGDCRYWQELNRSAEFYKDQRGIFLSSLPSNILSLFDQ